MRSSRLRSAIAGSLGLLTVLAAATGASAGTDAPPTTTVPLPTTAQPPATDASPTTSAAPTTVAAAPTTAPAATEPAEPRVDRDGNTMLDAPADVAVAGEQAYIVEVDDAAAVDEVLEDVGPGVAPTLTFERAVDGFAASLTPTEVAELRANDDVVAVEPDRPITLSGTQTSPPWGLDRIDQRPLPLNGSYRYNVTGAGVDAYVIDSGINRSHTDFTGRIPRGFYVNFGDGRGLTDCNGHGTHVAGTVAGTTYGVAKQARIVPIKVFSCSGSTSTSNILAGIEWAINDHLPGRPAVANLSLGGSPSTILDDAVRRLIADGVTVVVAAGNDAQPTCNYSPPRVAQAITVAASDRFDDDAYFSNYGSCNDLFAPGVDITSASAFSSTGATTMSGTSMAAPHVAGVAALILQVSPSMTPAAVASRIDADSTKGVLSECCGDPDKLLHAAVAAPVAPTRPGAVGSLAATRGDRMVRLTWTVPANTGGAAITDYIVERWSAADPVWRVVPEGVRGSTGAAATSLVVGGQYRFRISARNSVGVGTATATGTVVAVTLASVPRSFTATAALRSVVLRWQAPAATGGMAVSDYAIQRSQDGGGTWVTVADPVSTATQFTVTGLASATQQLFRVAARTGGVTGVWTSPVSAVPT